MPRPPVEYQGDETLLTKLKTSSPTEQMVRVFGKPISAYFACPSCGTIMRFGGGRRAKGINCTHDSKLSTVQCAQCARRWVVGLMIWSRKNAGPKHGFRRGHRRGVDGQTPADQIPNIRERAQLNAENGAWWASQNLIKYGPANRTLECLCEEGRNVKCPLHGGELTPAMQAVKEGGNP